MTKNESNKFLIKGVVSNCRELKTTNKNVSFMGFIIRVPMVKQDGSDYKETTLSVTLWDKIAEEASVFLEDGITVEVFGQLKLSKQPLQGGGNIFKTDLDVFTIKQV